MSANALENCEFAMTTTGASRAKSPAFTQELLWRHPPATLLPADSAERLLVTRWRNSQETAHRERGSATDCCVVALSMQAVSVRIMRDGATVYDGALPPGAMFLAAPGEELTADFDGPCDFLHIYLPACGRVLGRGRAGSDERHHPRSRQPSRATGPQSLEGMRRRAARLQ